MTYHDTYAYEAARPLYAELKALRDAPNDKMPKLFARHCRKAIAAQSAGLMPLRDAAYAIAGAMFIKPLAGQKFDNIMVLAGELEMPSQFVNGDPEQKWYQLMRLVGEYEEAVA